MSVGYSHYSECRRLRNEQEIEQLKVSVASMRAQEAEGEHPVRASLVLPDKPPQPVLSLKVEEEGDASGFNGPGLHVEATESVPAPEPHRGLSDSATFRNARFIVTIVIFAILFVVWVAQRRQVRA